MKNIVKALALAAVITSGIAAVPTTPVSAKSFYLPTYYGGYDYSHNWVRYSIPMYQSSQVHYGPRNQYRR